MNTEKINKVDHRSSLSKSIMVHTKKLVMFIFSLFLSLSLSQVFVHPSIESMMRKRVQSPLVHLNEAALDVDKKTSK